MAALKRISGIILCLFAILLMSHNTFAIDYGATGSSGWTTSSRIWYVDVYGTNTVNYGTINTSDGIAFASPTTLGATYEISLFYRNQPTNKNLVSIPYRVCFSNPDDMKAWVGFSSNNYYYLISNSWEYTSAGCISGIVTYFANGGYSSVSLGAGGPIIGSVAYSYNIVFGKASYTLVSSDTDYTSVLNAIKNNTDDIKTKLDEIADSADAALDREQSETQDAADDAQDAGDTSSSDATTATSSLISVIGGFVNVLTSAQPTNCKINANLNHINMGQLDLCANPVPSYIQIIGSIILICAAIPLAIVLFNRFIGLFRSFQG